MIDEKKLIEKIEKMVIPLSTPDGSESIDIGINGYNECLVDVLETIKDQPKVGEWIPVEDRLPEDNQAVLTCKNKHISILIWKSERRRWLEPKGNWWWSYCMVEKWQPLPEPFKGD